MSPAQVPRSGNVGECRGRVVAREHCLDANAVADPLAADHQHRQQHAVDGRLRVRAAASFELCDADSGGDAAELHVATATSFGDLRQQ